MTGCEASAGEDSRRWRGWAGRLAGAVVALVVIWLGVGRLEVPPAGVISLRLRVDQAAAVGVGQPLIVTGRPVEADFLGFRLTEAGRGHFFFDSWGVPEVRSEAVNLPAGEPVVVRVELPSLRALRGAVGELDPWLRIDVDGKRVLETKVKFHRRARQELYWGYNPVGGTSTQPRLAGRLEDEKGRDLVGRSAVIPRPAPDWAVWVMHFPVQVLLLALVAWALVAAGGKLAQARVADWRSLGSAMGDGLRRHRWFAGSAAVSVLAFFAMVTQGSFRLEEAPKNLNDFYDYQMLSLLEGRLDVPDEAIGGEAFVYAGKLYGYFGMTPALLRLPLVAFDLAFGQWSRLLMTVWFFAALLAAYLILLEAVRVVRGDDAARPGAATVVVHVLATGLGSTLFYLSSRSYVYHEAILCGAMLALAAAWGGLRYLRSGRLAWWGWAWVCGVLSLHARPTTGLYALTLLGFVALVPLWRAWRPLAGWPAWPVWGRSVGLGVLCLVGAFTFNLQAYLKFGTFNGAPLELNRLYTPERLARIEGKNMHVANVPFNFDTYLVHPNLRVEPRFPWLFWESRTPRREYPSAKIDLPDHTVAMTYTMPGLLLLATLGALATAWRWRSAREPLAVIWLGLGPMALLLLTAIATAHRYTGDFCPFLIAAAAWGLAGLDALTSRWRRVGLTLLGVGLAWSIALTAALTIHYQRAVVWGVAPEVKAEYQRWQQASERWFHARPVWAEPASR